MVDDGDRDVIPNSMQLVAGRTGQEYNQRKDRKGAYWEDRYHATAVESGNHLARCMVYVDLNMVRAGVVAHPSEWPFCGYNDIEKPRQRKSLIDRKSLISLFGVREMDEFKGIYRGWVSEGLEKQEYRERDSGWTESIAVGREGFVRDVKKS